jgi:alpha-L-arabinofuranosidase
METEIMITSNGFSGPVQTITINGPGIKAENTFNTPDQVRPAENKLAVKKGEPFYYTFEPHSITALICNI